MSPQVHAAIFAGVIPALVSLAAVLLSRLIARNRQGGGQHTGLALAIGLGTVAAHLGNAFPAFPPLDVTDRLPFLVGLALLLGFLEANWPSPWWARGESRLLLAAVVLGAILGPVSDSLADRAGFTWILTLFAAWLASWANLEALAARLPAPAFLPSLALTPAAIGVTFLVSDLSATLGFLALGGSVAIAAAWLGSLRSTVPNALARGAAPVLVTSVGGLLLLGNVYAGLPARVALLLLAAPLGAWVGAVGPLRRLGGWEQGLGMVVATLIPLALAIGLVMSEAATDGY